MLVRVIGIVGSPRKDSNTEILVRGALEGVINLRKDVKTELLLLREKNIQLCRGCNEVCYFGGKGCPIEDDMPKILDKLLKSDAYIFGSPTYFGGISGLLRTFMDRTVPLFGKLKNKVAGIITVGDGKFGGQELAAQSIRVFCLNHSMILNQWHISATAGHGTIAEEISKNQGKLDEAKKLGRNITELALRMKSTKKVKTVMT